MFKQFRISRRRPPRTTSVVTDRRGPAPMPRIRYYG
jgi:hypothetical protein